VTGALLTDFTAYFQAWKRW